MPTNLSRFVDGYVQKKKSGTLTYYQVLLIRAVVLFIFKQGIKNTVQKDIDFIAQIFTLINLQWKKKCERLRQPETNTARMKSLLTVTSSGPLCRGYFYPGT